MVRNTENPYIVTTTELAAILGVGRRNITRWAKGGKIPYFRTVAEKLGHYRFDLREVAGGFDGAHWQRESAAYKRALAAIERARDAVEQERQR